MGSLVVDSAVGMFIVEGIDLQPVNTKNKRIDILKKALLMGSKVRFFVFLLF